MVTDHVTPWTLSEHELALLRALTLDYVMLAPMAMNDPAWTRLYLMGLIEVHHSVTGHVGVRTTQAGWKASGRYMQ